MLLYCSGSTTIA